MKVMIDTNIIISAAISLNGNAAVFVLNLEAEDNDYLSQTGQPWPD